MENIEIMKTIIQLAMLAAIVIVTLLTFKSALKWKKGDTFQQFIERSLDAHNKGIEARKNMFGSTKNTLIALLTVFAFLWIITILTPTDSPRFLRYTLLIYLIIGFLKSKKLVDAHKNEGYENLGFHDKIIMRFYFVATWPIYIGKKSI